MIPITLRDIAGQLHFSVATVSRALNPTTAHLISEPVRLTIQNAARKMGYQSDVMIKRSMEGRSYTLGVAIATAFHSHFFSDHLTKIFEGIYAVLQKKKRYGCKLVLLPREKSLSEIDRYVLSSQVDGLLISTQCDFSVHELYQLAEHLQERSKRPVVAINLPFKKNSSINVVSYDNREAARRAVGHLLKRGPRQIGLIYADNNSEDVRERIEGFKLALSARGIALRPGLMARGDFSTPGGYKAACEILKRKLECDALFCVNDEMALGALVAIRDAGKKCPQDIAVMGFDGLAAGELTYPRLTTMAQPATEMAAVATTLLIDRIEGKQRIPTTTRLDARLLLRDSA